MMKYNIISISEKIPKITTLPNGFYTGRWGGYIVEVVYQQKIFELKTEEGVRGMNIPVIVEIVDGIASFDELKT